MLHKTTLVLCSHGTDNPEGQATISKIVARVQQSLPGVTVLETYVDVQQPQLPEVLSTLALAERIVVVPLLLSRGYHTEFDIKKAVASQEHPERIVVTPPLGPDSVLAEVLQERLEKLKVEESAPVVIAAAGSSISLGVEDAQQMQFLLQSLRPGTVSLAFLSAAKPTVTEAVAELAKAGEPVVVASYLLANGFFQSKLKSTPGTLVTEPIGAAPALTQLVLKRFEDGLRY